MKWFVRKVGEKCIIEVPANILEDEISESLKELMKDLTDDGFKMFYLDMNRISKANSKALAAIIHIYKFAAYYDIEIRLFNIQPYVYQLIYQTRLNQIFDICESDYSIMDNYVAGMQKTA
jgi:anti-anti-sigma factor